MVFVIEMIGKIIELIGVTNTMLHKIISIGYLSKNIVVQ